MHGSRCRVDQNEAGKTGILTMGLTKLEWHQKGCVTMRWLLLGLWMVGNCFSGQLMAGRCKTALSESHGAHRGLGGAQGVARWLGDGKVLGHKFVAGRSGFEGIEANYLLGRRYKRAWRNNPIAISN
jgi:hypothetical protein